VRCACARQSGSARISGDRRQTARSAPANEVMNIIGDVRGRVCALVDDIVDFRRHVCNARTALGSEQGAEEVYCLRNPWRCLSGVRAVARIQPSGSNSVVRTDSIAATRSAQMPEHPAHLHRSPFSARRGRAIQQRSQRYRACSIRLGPAGYHRPVSYQAQTMALRGGVSMPGQADA